ncbi:hypothetical protein FGG08_006847 [Glutinoglossum americanum]|uniref:Uncharacterized protein n=1 Tax=Glutinoglossum americanum TaxID=1670608 RepID=A0A9P8HVG8_9PEZI|nr:hypothetical protein FGG08_006847 [Glutinoglossum americanum]
MSRALVILFSVSKKGGMPFAWYIAICKTPSKTARCLRSCARNTSGIPSGACKPGGVGPQGLDIGSASHNSNISSSRSYESYNTDGETLGGRVDINEDKGDDPLPSNSENSFYHEAGNSALAGEQSVLAREPSALATELLEITEKLSQIAEELLALAGEQSALAREPLALAGKLLAIAEKLLAPVGEPSASDIEPPIPRCAMMHFFNRPVDAGNLRTYLKVLPKRKEFLKHKGNDTVGWGLFYKEEASWFMVAAIPGLLGLFALCWFALKSGEDFKDASPPAIIAMAFAGVALTVIKEIAEQNVG